MSRVTWFTKCVSTWFTHYGGGRYAKDRLF